MNTAPTNNLRPALLFFLVGCLFGVSFNSQTVGAAIDPKERLILGDNLVNIYRSVKQIFHCTRQMNEDARPFLRPRYAARYRFEPSQERARRILSESRLIKNRIMIDSALLSQSTIPDVNQKLRAFLQGVDRMGTFAKRALRAIKDHNHVLYLASAQGAEGVARDMFTQIHDLELALMERFEANDDAMEDL